MTPSKRTFSALAFASLLTAASTSRAAIVTYTVDPLLSSLSLAGDVTVAGPTVLPFTPQGGPGSMLAFYSGGITGDLIGSTLSFTGASVAALPNPLGPFDPLPPSGVPLDNYGVFLGATTAPVAYRAIEFSLDGAVTSGAAPGASGLGFLPPSYADYDATALGGGPGTVDLTALPPAPNTSIGLVDISDDGAIETLTIPVTVTYTGTVAGAPFTSVFDGTIVATRAIPEPGAFALGLVGMAGLLFRRRR